MSEPIWQCETQTASAWLKKHNGGATLLYIMDHGIHEAYCVVTKKDEAALLAVLRERAGTCKWKPDGDLWITDCGKEWMFEDGGPIENQTDYCQGCGKPVEVGRGGGR